LISLDLVLLEAYKALSNQVKSIEDMDSLTMDIVEEHLDQNQKEEAEREFAQEIAPQPLTIPLPGNQSSLAVPLLLPGNQFKELPRPPFPIRPRPILDIQKKIPSPTTDPK
jgi:hypothetical protein